MRRIDELHTAYPTMGWPRLINNLANTCLLCGRQESKKEIDEEIVRVAAEEAGL